MKDLTPKVDSSAGDDGKYPADEFNDAHNDLQNAVIKSNQTLTTSVGDDNFQLLKAIASGGATISRGDSTEALVGDIVLPDNSSGNISIDLPPVADLFLSASVYFVPVRGQLYSANSLTVGRNSQSILGDSSDFVLNSITADNQILRFFWVAGSVGWNVINIGIIAV